MKTESQCRRILDYLKRGNSITPATALRWYGSMRLGARIYELKHAGHPIVSTMVTTRSGARVASYRMERA